MKQAGFGQEENFKISKNVRGDKFMWVTGLPQFQTPENSQLCNLIEKQLALKAVFNEVICEPEQKISDTEAMLAKYSGAGEFYLRHKDAFKLDVNNIEAGQNLRKLTMITYLNAGLDELPMKDRGNLKLYLEDEIVQIVPRLGRTILFKSELMEHEVLPTSGFKRLALTTWFSHKHSRVPEVTSKRVLDPQGTIFIGIPAYRDPQLFSSVRSLVEKAKMPERLRVGVFIQASRDEDQSTCFIDDLKEQYPKLMQTKEVHYSEAKNVFYARN